MPSSWRSLTAARAIGLQVQVLVSSRRQLPRWATRGGNWLVQARAVKRRLRELGLNTVCESARCPNIGECFSRRTATFMILGTCCTRRCGFCAVSTGRPLAIDREEPGHVADAASGLELDYVVVTSVTRDDLCDGGASQFAATIRALRDLQPPVRVEVLVPDFRGKAGPLNQVLEAGPQMIAHNLETVKRLTPRVRPQGSYERSLELLNRAAQSSCGAAVKSGLMVGLGEKQEEVGDALVDLRQAGCEVVTIGQYLRPSRFHLPVSEYLPVEVFTEYANMAVSLGFVHVSAGALVRSSYRAREGWEAVAGEKG